MRPGNRKSPWSLQHWWALISQSCPQSAQRRHQDLLGVEVRMRTSGKTPFLQALALLRGPRGLTLRAAGALRTMRTC